jgi:hypothetical protein
MLQHASTRRALASLAAALTLAGLIACEATTPGLGASAPADALCLPTTAPGDAVDGSAGTTASAPTGDADTDGGAGAATDGGGDAAPTAADMNVGPDPVCATGQ